VAKVESAFPLLITSAIPSLTPNLTRKFLKILYYIVYMTARYIRLLYSGFTFAMITFIACNKGQQTDPDTPAAPAPALPSILDLPGTYAGAMRYTGAYVRPTATSSEMGSWDSTIPWTFIVQKIGADTLRITGSDGSSRSFLYDSSNVYCTLPCDPTRLLYRFTLKPRTDSLIFRDYYAGGGPGGYYNWSSRDFSGHR
jgi:hypothetical protein